MRNDILQQAQAIREAMGKVTATLTDEQALEVKELYPLWSGDRVKVYDGTDGKHPQTKVRGRTSGLLYKCNIGHTTQDDWPPETTPNLWVVVNESNKGTIDDPIPAERGMEYEYGKYYLDPEDGKTYLCERGSETGTIVLHYLPHELTDIYFTLV
jgi:hypothetical protein